MSKTILVNLLNKKQSDYHYTFKYIKDGHDISIENNNIEWKGEWCECLNCNWCQGDITEKIIIKLNFYDDLFKTSRVSRWFCSDSCIHEYMSSDHTTSQPISKIIQVTDMTYGEYNYMTRMWYNNYSIIPDNTFKNRSLFKKRLSDLQVKLLVLDLSNTGKLLKKHIKVTDFNKSLFKLVSRKNLKKLSENTEPTTIIFKLEELNDKTFNSCFLFSTFTGIVLLDRLYYIKNSYHTDVNIKSQIYNDSAVMPSVNSYIYKSDDRFFIADRDQSNSLSHCDVNNVNNTNIEDIHEKVRFVCISCHSTINSKLPVYTTFIPSYMANTLICESKYHHFCNEKCYKKYMARVAVENIKQTIQLL